MTTRPLPPAAASQVVEVYRASGSKEASSSSGEEEEVLQRMPLPTLRAELRRMGLSTQGSREALEDKLKAAKKARVRGPSGGLRVHGDGLGFVGRLRSSCSHSFFLDPGSWNLLPAVSTLAKLLTPRP
jgi:hypothetical protein